MYAEKTKVYFREYAKGQCIANLLSPTQYFIT